MDKLSVAIIGPDEDRRRQIVEAVEALDQQVAREFPHYPDHTNAGFSAGMGEFDIVLIDVDSDQEVAFSLVSQISSQDNTLTVMAYSAGANPEQVVRCMRAGAREYVSFPLVMSQVNEAFARAATRRPPDSRAKLVRKLFVFWGAKGGVGTTTLASNFAIALRAESEHRVALVDLNLQLGDVAMALGVEPQFSVVDALESGHRLDNEFLSALMVEHHSGVAVLAGPDQYITQPVIPNGNLSLLLQVLRDKYPYVVIDAGTGLGQVGSSLLKSADRVYLITEPDIPTLRNTQRLLAHIQSKNGSAPQVELVLNRFRTRGEIDEKRIVEALGVAVKWHVPNDFARVQEALNRGIPLADTHSSVTTVLRQMARLACGKHVPKAKRGWRIKLRGFASQPWDGSRSRS